MSRLKLLEDLYDESMHNMRCYSKDFFISKPKVGFENSWEEEKEKLELIKELIDEESKSNFRVHYPIKYLYEETNIRLNIELAYLEYREKGVSCYLTADETDETGNAKYSLVFSIHKKDEFDDEFENICIKYISNEFFRSREILKNEMERELKEFVKIIDNNPLLKKYYESKETEEFE